MLRNYLATALRNLVRNRVYAGLNIVALVLGFAAVLFIALFVRDELSYDRWLPGSGGVYMLSSNLGIPGQEPFRTNRISEDIAPAMKQDLPGVDKVVRLEPVNYTLRHGDVTLSFPYWQSNQVEYFADPDFFALIQLPVLAGDLQTALDRPDSVVLTRAMAHKLFGRDTPLGELVQLDSGDAMRVTAILKDLPSNTQFNTEVIFSSRYRLSMASRLEKNQLPPQFWRRGSYIYFTLKPGASIGDIDKGLADLVARHKPETIPVVGPSPLYTLPMTGLHLQPRVQRGVQSTLNPPGDRDLITAVALVGLLILAAASISYVNLATARASRRAVEVGMRKAVGAQMRDLAVQFEGESILYVAFAMIVAMAIVGLALPAANAILGRTVRFDFWADPALVCGILGVVLFVGVAAGAYPAFVLSRFHPKTVLKSGAMQPHTSERLRAALVALQFAILIGLLLSTLTIYRQTDYLLGRGTRMDIARVHVAFGGCSTAMKDALRAIPGVQGFTCSGAQVLNQSRGDEGIPPVTAPDGSKVVVSPWTFDMDFLAFYGVKPLAGRLFSPEFAADRPPDRPQGLPGQPPPPMPWFSVNVVINEALARKLSPGNPAGAVGMTLKEANRDNQVIGVVPDFAPDSARFAIPPAMYSLFPNAMVNMGGGLLNVRLKADADEGATLAAIDGAWEQYEKRFSMNRYPLEQYLKELNGDVILQAQVFAGFSVVAVLLAALGLIGLAAFMAERRTKEIGVRKTMGATRTEIVRLLLWEFAKPLLLANLIAWPAAYWAMKHWLEGFATQIDLAPWMFAGASALALAIGLAAVIGQAMAVAAAAPVSALRYE